MPHQVKPPNIYEESYPRYSTLLQEHLQKYSQLTDHKQRLVKFRHTCDCCNWLACFTEDYRVVQNCDRLKVQPKEDSIYRVKPTVITEPFDLHMYRLCCLAFGVGNWFQFNRYKSLNKYTENVLEFTAHMELGVYDLTHFWGLSVWPPSVKYKTKIQSQLLRQHDQQQQWLPEDDPIRDLFIDPIQFAKEFQVDAPSFLQSGICFAVRREFGASLIQTHMGQEALGLVPVGRVQSKNSAIDTFQYTDNRLKPADLEWEGKFPVFSAEDMFMVMLCRPEAPSVFGQGFQDQQAAYIELEQQVQKAGGNFDEVLEIFRARNKPWSASKAIKSGDVHAKFVKNQHVATLQAQNNERSQQENLKLNPQNDAESQKLQGNQEVINLESGSSANSDQYPLDMPPVEQPLPPRDPFAVEAGKQLLHYCEKAELRLVGRLAMSAVELESLIESAKKTTAQLHTGFTKDISVLRKYANCANELFHHK